MHGYTHGSPRIDPTFDEEVGVFEVGEEAEVDENETAIHRFLMRFSEASATRIPTKKSTTVEKAMSPKNRQSHHP